jgi:hypothetical protein
MITFRSYVVQGKPELAPSLLKHAIDTNLSLELLD